MKKITALILATLLVVSLGGAAFAADSDVNGFTLTPITWDGAGLGKVAVPEGFEMTTTVHCSDETTCLGAPLRVSVMLVSKDVPATMMFNASESYIERVKTNYPSMFSQVDGKLDGQTMVFMQRYRDAAGYCDWMMEGLDAPSSFYKDEDTSYMDDHLASERSRYANLVSGMSQYGIKVEWTDVTVAQRVYTYDIEDTTWAMCIFASVYGYQYNAAGEICCQWNVPANYMMTCPLDQYQQVHDEIFMPFVENTAVSDTFIQLQDDLTYQIRDETIQYWNMAVAASNAYAQAMSALTTASVESYLQSSNYSSSDRFSDYIFDRNTYTTSDGYEVSVSNSYDYVWEGDGVVYYSDSAFDVPNGAILLDPH